MSHVVIRSPTEVDVGELGTSRLVEASPSLEVEDAHRRHPRFVGRVVEQPIDPHQVEVGVRLGRDEQIADADADRGLAGTESLADLGQLAVGLQRSSCHTTVSASAATTSP